MSRRSFVSLLAAAVAVCALALAPATPAHAGKARSIVAGGYFILAGLQVPAVAFEAVAAVQLRGELDAWTGDATFATKASRAANANIAAAAIHGAKLLLWTGGGLAAMADDTHIFPLVVVALQGGLDMAGAIVGVVAGATLLGAKRAAGVAGTPMGDAATLSGVVHLVFGSISALVTLPELLVGVTGTIALARGPRHEELRLALLPSSVVLYGRF